MSFEYADWPAPGNIVAGVTTRVGGQSNGAFSSNNMAMHVEDDAHAVSLNRSSLDVELEGAQQWHWLNQVHGVAVAVAPFDGVETSDAVVCAEPNAVCTVLTADCLPILITDTEGLQVAAIHAGWRSLAGGIVSATMEALKQQASQRREYLAWLGPAISQPHFEVGDDVLKAFSGIEGYEAGFVTNENGKYQADLYHLARLYLNEQGVSAIFGGSECTFRQKDKYYSYRRESVTGRMASFIYRTK